MTRTDNYIMKISIIGILCIASIFCNKVRATHIVGGDITYVCLGNDNYKVTVTIRRDCELGDPEAEFDDPAAIGIYSGNGALLQQFGQLGMLLIPFNASDTLNNVLSADCGFLGSPVCVHETIYKGIIQLPYRPDGYILTYQRCCRNSSLNNIEDPLDTGGTYYIHLTGDAINSCNSSPKFNEWGDINICANQDLVFDHSATDADGDMLVYRLCTPSLGASADKPLPQPPSPPPFDEVTWSVGYGIDNMMGGGDPLLIDPVTGVLSANPNIVGQYLIGVCVDEYRDGVLLSTVRRDFEYNVRVCVAAPDVSFLTDDATCDGLDVALENTSTEVDEYFWYYITESLDTVLFSQEENPQLTLPEEGEYQILLEGIRSADGCSDIFVTNVIAIFSELLVDFTYEFSNCQEGGELILSLSSASTDTDPAYNPSSWEWIILQNNQAENLSGENVDYDLVSSDDISVTLAVTSSSGCVDDLTAIIPVDNIESQLEAQIGYEILGCEGDLINIQLIDLDAQANGVNTSDWTITIDGLSTEYTGTIVGLTVNADDVISVELTSTFITGCLADETMEIIAIELLQPMVNVTIDSCTMDGFDVTFTAEFNSNLVMTSVEWIINDETYDTPDVSLTEQDSLVEVSLTVTFDNGCVYTTSDIYDLNDYVAQSLIDVSLLECADDGFLISLEEILVGGAIPVSTEWIVIDGQNTIELEGSQVEYAATEIEIIVVLTSTFDDGCKSTSIDTVDISTLYPELKVEMKVNECDSDGNRIVAFTDASDHGSWLIENRLWTVFINNVADKFSITEASIDFTFDSDVDTFSVLLEVFYINGCTQSVQIDDVFMAGMMPLLSINAISSDCSDENVIVFFSADVTSGAVIEEYDWSITHDGVTSNFNVATIELDLTKEIVAEVYLSVLLDNGCIIETFRELTIEDIEFNFISASIDVCDGQSTPLVLNPNPDYTYEWSPLTGLDFGDPEDFSNPIATVSEATTYMVAVTDPSGVCSQEYSVDINITQSISLLIAGDAIICDGNVFLVVSGGLPSYEYEWSTSPDFSDIISSNDTLMTVIDVGNQTFYVQLSDGASCSSDPTSFSVEMVGLGIEIFEPFMICPGDTVDYPVLITEPSLNVVLEWSENDHIVDMTDPFNLVVGLADGDTHDFQLIYTGSNDLGCMITDTVDFIVAEPDVLSFDYEPESCESYTICFTHTSDVNGILIWDFGDPSTTDDVSVLLDPCYTYPAAGNYTVTLEEVSSICQSDPISVEISVPDIVSIDIETDTIRVCQNESVLLSATVIGSDEITWCDDDGNPLGSGDEIEVSFDADTLVYAKASNDLMCQAIDSVFIDVFDFDIELVAPDTVCALDLFTVPLVDHLELSNVSIVWGPEECLMSGQGTDVAIFTSTVDKEISVTYINNDNQCEITLTKSITVEQLNIGIDADPGIELIKGNQVDLTVTGLPDNYDIEWNTDEDTETISVTPLEPITYSVTVTDLDTGCEGVAIISINVISLQCDESDIFLPSAFSPNDDEANDILHIRSNILKSMELIIYDRWGEEVFKSTSISDGWDGTYKGKQLAPDVYAFCIKVVCIDDQDFISRGNVTLFR